MTAAHAHESEPGNVGDAIADNEALTEYQKLSLQRLANASDPSHRGVPFALWQRIQEIRIVRGWSQGELAERTGLPRVVIANLETSARVPQPWIIQAIAGALGIDVAEASALAGVQPLPDEPE